MIGEYPVSVCHIQPELDAVFASLRANLHANGETLLGTYLPQFDVDLVAPPAFVLFSARLFNNPKCAVFPALFLLLVHLAMTFHHLLPQIRGRDRQLVILVGDYLYAHLFFLLCEHDCLFLLEKFAGLIKEMNEGAVLRGLLEHTSHSPDDAAMVTILSKQYGFFFAECCQLGCLFAGSKQSEAATLRQFGIKFGIAYGASEAGLGSEFSSLYLGQSLDLLNALPKAYDKDELGKFAQEMVAAPSSKRFRSMS